MQIVNSRPIQVFNFGDMRRDFTYIDDIVAGTILALDNPPKVGGQNAPIQTFNLGAGNSEPLEKLISLIEENLGEKAIKNLEAGPRGEMLENAGGTLNLRERKLGLHRLFLLKKEYPNSLNGIDTTISADRYFNSINL